MAPETRGYDQISHGPGRSAEVDKIAHEAAHGITNDANGFKTNDADPVNVRNTPQGNPEDAAYKRDRKLGG